MQLYAIIVAGGSGVRMGSVVPKQFLSLCGKPVLMHTIEQFRIFDESIRIITVLPQNQIGYWNELQQKHSFTVPQTIVPGGPQRFHSVKNGLEFVTLPSLVAIHDGVRPLVSTGTIQRCFEKARETGNAVPSTLPVESIRLLTENGSLPVDRRLIRRIQTPQVFDAALIRKAYDREYSPEFTDDATVLEKAGHKISLVEGNAENIKITEKIDLLIAAALLPYVS